MPVSASPCIQYNTEKKNVKEVITAMSKNFNLFLNNFSLSAYLLIG